MAGGFFDAWTSKDFERARSLIHDDASFEGPIDNYSDTDSYLASLQQLSGIVTGTDKQKVLVDGDDVCVIYDLKAAPVSELPYVRVVSRPRREGRFRIGYGRCSPIRSDVRNAAAQGAPGPHVQQWTLVVHMCKKVT